MVAAAKTGKFFPWKQKEIPCSFQKQHLQCPFHATSRGEILGMFNSSDTKLREKEQGKVATFPSLFLTFCSNESPQ